MGRLDALKSKWATNMSSYTQKCGQFGEFGQQKLALSEDIVEQLKLVNAMEDVNLFLYRIVSETLIFFFRMLPRKRLHLKV